MINTKNKYEDNRSGEIKTSDDTQVHYKKFKEQKTQNADQKLSEPNEIRYVVLQTMNLIERFTIRKL